MQVQKTSSEEFRVTVSFVIPNRVLLRARRLNELCGGVDCIQYLRAEYPILSIKDAHSLRTAIVKD